MKYLSYLYLGIALGLFTNIYLFDWKFWVITIPFILMNTIEIKKKKVND